MNIRPIRTEEDLTWALAEVEPYFINEPQKGSDDAVRFEILADLIRAYETLNWSVQAPNEEADTEVAYAHRGLAYSDFASVRKAIKSARLGKVGRRSSLMGASPGRFVTSPGGRGGRTRRSLKTG